MCFIILPSLIFCRYKYKYCDREFAHSSSLSCHVKTQHYTEKKSSSHYYCEECSEPYVICMDQCHVLIYRGSSFHGFSLTTNVFYHWKFPCFVISTLKWYIMKEPWKFSPSNVLSYTVFYRVNDAKELVQHIQSIHETKVLSQTKKFNNMTKFE